ncbi:MAG: type II toxin-antitoxin system RelE/ParE family toxin [Pseudomonadota bacterium]
MTTKAQRYEVVLTAGAERDLESIYDYIAEFDSAANAKRVLDMLMKVADSLALFPERGGYPKELVAVGIKEYRQTTFKSYRVIYRIDAAQVQIYLIVDCRRDLPSMLARRLLGH